MLEMRSSCLGLGLALNCQAGAGRDSVDVAPNHPSRSQVSLNVILLTYPAY